jgi:hypothetical protein
MFLQKMMLPFLMSKRYRCRHVIKVPICIYLQPEGEVASLKRDRRRGECGLNIVGEWRGGRVVECGGLENRCPAIAGPGVRTPLSPQS